MTWILSRLCLLAAFVSVNVQGQVGDCAYAVFDPSRALDTKKAKKPRGSTSDYVRRAWRYFDEGRLDLALQALDRASQLEPLNAEVPFVRGNMLAHYSRDAEAITAFTLALAIDPASPYSYYSRGRSYQSSEQAALAVDDHTRALELRPDFFYAQYGLASALGSTGRTIEALVVLNKAEEAITAKLKSDSDPSCHVYLYFMRAIVLTSAKRYNEAMRDFNSAIELEPRNHLNFHYRAGLYTAIKANNQAIEDYTRSIELSPFFADNYRSRARVYELIGKKRAAEADRQRFAELSSPKKQSGGFNYPSSPPPPS